MLIANNVQILNKEVDFLFTSEDVKKSKNSLTKNKWLVFTDIIVTKNIIVFN